MSRAADTVLDQLHALVFAGLSEELSRAIERARLPKTIEDADGNPVKNPDYEALNPQLIDKALKALKDNGVDAPARSSRVDNLASQLRDLDLDDEGVGLRATH